MTPPAIGPYSVVRELGRGGMGVVYEVRHPAHPGRLALKVSSSAGIDPLALDRFEREGRLLAKVAHPGVVRVHVFARERGRPYVVTDLVEGQNLHHVAREPLDPARAARIVAALCDAVSAIHAAGILHRDLKPENVILRPDDAPVLLDFGLAREQDARSLTLTGAVVGTPAYVSPEQATGAKGAILDERTDVYGLGAILFELLAARPPFDVSGDVQKVVAVLTKEPRWPSATRKDVPRALEAILRRAMAKDPAARFPTARALGEALRGFAPAGKRGRAPRGLALLVAGLVAGGVALVALRGRVGAPPPPAPSSPATTSSATTTEPAVPRLPDPPAPRLIDSPPGFRALVRWLARPDTRTHPGRSRVETAVKRVQERGELRRLSLAGAIRPEEPVVPRFISGRWLAVLVASSTVLVADLDQEAPELSPLWELPVSPQYVGRSMDLAVARSRRGGLAAFLATDAGLFEAPLPPAVGAAARARPFEPPIETTRTNAVASSSDGRWLAFGCSPRAIVVMDQSAKEGLTEFGTHEDASALRALLFANGDRDLLVATAAGVDDESRSHLARHDPATGQMKGRPIRFTGDVRTVLLDPRDPDRVFFASGSELVTIRVSDWSVVTRAPSEGSNVALGGRDAPVLYSVNGYSGVVTVAELGDAPLRRRRERGRVNPARKSDQVALSPDGAILAIGGEVDGATCVQLWAAGD